MEIVQQDKWIGKMLNMSLAMASDLQPWDNYYLLRAKEMEVLLSLYKIKKVKRILEIGCGNGFTSTILSKSSDEVISTDLLRPDVKTHSVGISTARELFKRLDIANCSVVSCLGEKLPFEDKTFDLVFSLYTLEHIHDRGQAVREVRRVLKDGGEAIFIVPSFMERLLYPFTHYWEICAKAVDMISKKNKPNTISSHNEEAARRNIKEAANGSISAWRRFRNSYPHFPMPDPHGEYPDYFVELIETSSFAWLKLMRKAGLKPKEAFTIMLFPKAFSSIFLGGRSLEAYIKTLWINKRFGKGFLLRHLGQNLCLILEKDDAQGDS